jgi:hypothetical protein
MTLTAQTLLDREINQYKTAWFDSKPKRTRHKHFEVYQLGSKYVICDEHDGWRECMKPRGSYNVGVFGNKTHYASFEQLQKTRQDDFDNYVERTKEFYKTRVRVV